MQVIVDMQIKENADGTISVSVEKRALVPHYVSDPDATPRRPSSIEIYSIDPNSPTWWEDIFLQKHPLSILNKIGEEE